MQSFEANSGVRDASTRAVLTDPVVMPRPQVLHEPAVPRISHAEGKHGRPCSNPSRLRAVWRMWATEREEARRELTAASCSRASRVCTAMGGSGPVIGLHRPLASEEGLDFLAADEELIAVAPQSVGAGHPSVSKPPASNHPSATAFVGCAITPASARRTTHMPQNFMQL